jgi:thiol-disulfide isomerase/thioredoxin
VIVLLGIGFLAGVVTAVSPCVLPVLPVLLAGGATGRKPLRIASGVAIGLVALGFAFNVDSRFQTALPGYTDAFQKHVEGSAAARRELARLRDSGTPKLVARKTPVRGSTAGLPDYGVAPPLKPDGEWFNTKPFTLKGLRGKVVLIDFWTYSCINCLRTLPHLKAWDAAYRSRGLVIVGVHTPEFAFEHVSSNVRDAVERLGIEYPVVQDNAFGTWDSYANQYWPAEYMLDRNGHVRHVHYGEGSYDETEALIRKLLGANDVAETKVRELLPTGRNTPESYLGFLRLDRYVGTPVRKNRLADYAFAKRLGPDRLSYDGSWRVGGEHIEAGKDARLRLRFSANDVYLVLGGKGQVGVRVAGRPTKTVRVDGYRLYTLRESPKRAHDALLELRFSPGVRAYAFTFG